MSVTSNLSPEATGTWQEEKKCSNESVEISTSIDYEHSYSVRSLDRR